MKKYKLIKKLPFESSPEIGYISQEKPGEAGAHYWNHNWFHPEDYPEYWEEVVKPLLITEDRVEIFEHGILFYIQGSIIDSCHSDSGFYHDNKENTKFFSEKKAAQEYFTMTVPCLSIKDIAPIIGECNNTTYIDLDKLTEKLKSCVVSKMWKKVHGE
jgi:hypothetical protein